MINFTKSLQDNLIDKIEEECLCNDFTEYLDETKNESFFINMNKKVKLKTFNNIKVKMNLELIT